ncbi:MAG: 3-isopropylmalate dehydratase [Kiritimatiellae bacterium]|jgi:3-isopropylmalate/(R)-2-methylmalate dehydratase small subunit|nr:3-isopropylmalate dehydratase [Kiritimatiellia bacterium]
MSKESVIKGPVYVLEDNVDTDLLIPACYLNLVPTIPEEYRKLGSYALAGLPDGCIKFTSNSDGSTPYPIIIGGRNFGCGSSREHAPIALGAAGTKAVVAESYARIFFRNSVATGEIYPLESETRLCDCFKTGDLAELNIAKSTITRISDGKVFSLKPIGAVAPVIAAGGMFAYAREIGMIKS